MKTILIIDDSESHRFLLQEELAEEGFKVITASSNDEVLSKYRGLNPDLIILELRQREAGEQSFEELRKRYSDIPWIGYSTFTQCPEEFKKWVNFYFPKSWEIAGLKKLIKSL